MRHPLAWLFRPRRLNRDRSAIRRRTRRMRLEGLENRWVMDASGLPPPIPAADVALVGNCLPEVRSEAEGESAAVGLSMAEPVLGRVYLLQDGKQFVLDRPGEGRILGPDGKETAYIEVEVRRDPNAISIRPGVGMIQTLMGMLTPPGKTLLGDRLETLDGEFLELPPPPDDANAWRFDGALEEFVPARRYYVWGIDRRLDADGSRNLNAADLLAMITQLRECRDEAASPTDAESLAMDANLDGVLSRADLLLVARQLQLQADGHSDWRVG